MYVTTSVTTTTPEKISCRVRVWIAPGFTVIAADLPGCVSEGKDMGDCLRNIREAFAGCAESYLEDTGQIPWSFGGERPMFFEERVLTVELPNAAGVV